MGALTRSTFRASSHETVTRLPPSAASPLRQQGPRSRRRCRPLPPIADLYRDERPRHTDAAPGNGACADSPGRAPCAPQSPKRTGWPARTGSSSTCPAGTGAHPGRQPAADHHVRSRRRDIDGYTSRAARPTLPRSGRTPIPGIEMRGNGTSAREMGLLHHQPEQHGPGLRCSSNLWRGHLHRRGRCSHNRSSATGSATRLTRSASGGQYGIVLNIGAHDNIGRDARPRRSQRHRQLGRRHRRSTGPGTDWQHRPEQPVLHPAEWRRDREL